MIFVAYDSEVLQCETIERTIRGIGVNLLTPARTARSRAMNTG